MLGMGPEGHVASIFPDSPGGRRRAPGRRRARLPQAAADADQPGLPGDHRGRGGLAAGQRRGQGRRRGRGAGPAPPAAVEVPGRRLPAAGGRPAGCWTRPRRSASCLRRRRATAPVPSEPRTGGPRRAAGRPGRARSAAVQRLLEEGVAVGVAAPLPHVRQVRLVGLGPRGRRRVLLVLPGRQPAARAVPGLRDVGVGREGDPRLVPVRAPEPTRCRGAASPRSASPIGPAPTRLPRIALPPATSGPLIVGFRSRGEFDHRAGSLGPAQAISGHDFARHGQRRPPRASRPGSLS